MHIINALHIITKYNHTNTLSTRSFSTPNLPPYPWEALGLIGSQGLTKTNDIGKNILHFKGYPFSISSVKQKELNDMYNISTHRYVKI